MKSKVKFGLDAENNAIIEGAIEWSEDLRDQVAIKFKENFKSTGNLAVMTFCFGANDQFRLTPFGGNGEDSKKMVNYLSTFQLQNLMYTITEELKNRTDVAPPLEA